MRRRLETLNATLAQTTLHGVPQPVRLSASYGLASFTQLAQLEAAIEQADAEMYRRKQNYKAQQREQFIS